MSTEKDVGVKQKSPAPSPGPHIQAIIAKANKLLGLLKRTCLLLADVSVRRSLYMTLMKSQLSYATQVLSPDQIYLKTQLKECKGGPESESLNNIYNSETSYGEPMTVNSKTSLSFSTV